MITDRTREGTVPIRFLEFFLTRNIGTLVDTAVLWLMADLVFKGSHVGENIVSPAISFEVATIVNYITSCYWIYPNRIEGRTAGQLLRQFFTFNLSSVLGFLIKMVLLLLIRKWLGWHIVLCNLMALTVSGMFNYALADKWVFCHHDPRPSREMLSREKAGEMIPLLRGPRGQRFAGLLMRILGIDKLNILYDKAADSEGAMFASCLLDELQCDCQIGHAERLQQLPKGAFITISNHPYGSLDGIMLVDLIGSRRTDFKVMVNEILALVEPLTPSFITVTPTGNTKQSIHATNLAGIREVLNHIREGHPMGFFPSGAVSDYHPREHAISDRQWQDSLIRLIQKAEVPVVPIRFYDRNSRFFYFLGLISWRIRVLRLPRELLWQRGRMQRIDVGEVISVDKLRQFESLEALRDYLRACVYDIPMPESFTPRRELYGKNQTNDRIP